MAGYSSFSFRAAKHKFSLVEKKAPFTKELKPVEPSALLVGVLERGIETMALNNEKSRSEFVVAQVMLEIAYNNRTKVSILSGENLEADKSLDLNGECDFIISSVPSSSTIETPIICMVECENDNLMSGMGQCVAQMVGAQLVNEREGTAQPYIYGCVTTGNDWKFLKLEDKTVFTDTATYYIENVPIILGVFQSLIDEFAQK